jgi:hypothetical protein
MSLGLSNIDATAGHADVAVISDAARDHKSGWVKSLGVLSLLLAVVGSFIPLIGFFMLIAALLISRHALKISCEFYVSYEDERYARWASAISKVVLILGALGTVLFVLTNL